ncbi:DNA-binding protein [Pseudoxanthomonas winnipegensis]|uniref:helix-turn-helix domain-containing protein n=1 Tax=Pseudoxanthomonas winnipegensis TaxID=2480810 RepID=UPI00102DE676|nr:helix-turn-helix domain-containing protein [Pseudoxanthomonas winnipegensis]TAA43831.1 DNA-binding protein [Pseudoxanthomonas winnipegensis]
MTNPSNKLAYPIEEAFALIGVSRTRGYQLINSGSLRTYKAGKRRLCSHSALVDCQREMEKASAQRTAAA